MHDDSLFCQTLVLLCIELTVTDGAREHDGIVQRQQRDGPEVTAVAAEAQEAAEHQQRASVTVEEKVSRR